jgi:hypothetical protein
MLAVLGTAWALERRATTGLRGDEQAPYTAPASTTGDFAAPSEQPIDRSDLLLSQG